MSGRETSPSFFSFLAGDSAGRAFFNTIFLSFRFAARESTGTSSVGSASELDDESEDESLFRFNFETAGVDRELTDDDDDDGISLASGRQGHERAIINSVRIGPWKSNLRYPKSYPKSNSTWSSRGRVVVLSVIRLPWPLLLGARAMNGLRCDALQHLSAQSA